MILRGGRSDRAPARGACGDGVALLMKEGEVGGRLCCYSSGGFMVMC